MTNMEIWLLCFMPIQILFDIYFLIVYGTLGNMIKNATIKAFVEMRRDGVHCRSDKWKHSDKDNSES